MSSRNSLVFNLVNEKIDLESVHKLVAIINQHLDKLLANAKAWQSLKTKCNSKIKIENQEFFEFADHSVVSNLHWGIENIEAAMQANSADEKALINYIFHSQTVVSLNFQCLPSLIRNPSVTRLRREIHVAMRL
ncbi:hypothetical protein LIER_40262 [Lithospermum erythrorhizon]|uniref:Putative E3 ubiquitin-protein ligase LIN N-terminal domain-containing protein n=1 Tax=Lithospermum erythrorhizon TaxID=34254 RepID=A0AAV3QW38_LITER